MNRSNAASAPNTRPRLTVVSGVGAVSLLVMATLFIGVVASPVLANKGEQRGSTQPQRQVEHVRLIAQSLVRSAARLARAQRDVPVTVDRQSIRRADIAGTKLDSGTGHRLAWRQSSRVAVWLLNTPPPAEASAM